MSSQRSGARRQSRKRESILQGVYEENLRTKHNEPTPRHQEPEPEEARHGRGMRWGAVFTLVMFVLVTGAAYVTGGPSLLRQQLFPPVQSPQSVSPPVDDSLRGRSLPFASNTRSETPVLPLRGGGQRSVAGLFGLGVKTIVIDPGHGGKKDGAVGPGGTREKHVALDVAKRLRSRLEAHYGYRILMTRTSDRHLSLRDRVRFANRHQADLFLSIHVNSLPDSSVTSVETYYYGREASEKARRLAERENRASGYSVAEFNELLDEVGQRLRLEESRRLAASIQKSLYRNIKGHNPEVRDWGVRTAPFVVLLGVEAPSILAEIGVISNPAEEQKLRRPAYREQLARYLEEGVARYLGQALPAAAAQTDTTRAAMPSALR